LKQSGGHEGALAAAVRRLRSWHSLADAPQLNIANPPTGTQKKVEIDSLEKLCVPSTAAGGGVGA